MRVIACAEKQNGEGPEPGLWVPTERARLTK